MEHIQKSPTQLMLEAQQHRGITDIVTTSLETHRQRRNLVVLVAMDLGVSTVTLYRWCADLGIDIDEYRRPVAKVSVLSEEKE